MKLATSFIGAATMPARVSDEIGKNNVHLEGVCPQLKNGDKNQSIFGVILRRLRRLASKQKSQNSRIEDEGRWYTACVTVDLYI